VLEISPQSFDIFLRRTGAGHHQEAPARLTRSHSAPTAKQNLTAIRMLFDWLVTGQIVPVNPAASVRGPRHVVKVRDVRARPEARTLLDSKWLGRPAFLLVCPWAHRAKTTKAFVETLGGKLQLLFLPPYSPDRNPDELVWKHLKADTVGCSALQNYADLKGEIIDAFLAAQRRENPLLLPKGHAQIRRLTVYILLY
jgi:DDE superfamily endonuclease